MDSTNNNKISEAELKKKSEIIDDSNKILETVKNIMKDGEKEFVKKTGRRMTYAEMREIYG